MFWGVDRKREVKDNAKIFSLSNGRAVLGDEIGKTGGELGSRRGSCVLGGASDAHTDFLCKTEDVCGSLVVQMKRIEKQKIPGKTILKLTHLCPLYRLPWSLRSVMKTCPEGAETSKTAE